MLHHNCCMPPNRVRPVPFATDIQSSASLPHHPGLETRRTPQQCRAGPIGRAMARVFMSWGISASIWSHVMEIKKGPADLPQCIWHATSHVSDATHSHLCLQRHVCFGPLPCTTASLISEHDSPFPARWHASPAEDAKAFLRSPPI